ncbi:MAG TPA: 4-(cytidine 5'-diphospho)-2-C-methyl-D-erythritol kinase [Clostridia bacterium]|nr:4-(cytidine 5'-diphospho)-2-C-methyl-D-erythritol kinase [Clostridia bacterium]
MTETILQARAKVNLTLDVVERLQDGYHRVEMVLHRLDLADRVKITVGSTEGPIRVKSDSPLVPEGRANIAYRAAQLIRDRYGIDRGITVGIEKNIPVAAGLGGGSADAAAVIEGLNMLLGLDLDTAGMMRLGALLGADIPYCFMTGPALAQGKGEILTPIPSTTMLDLLLVKPDFPVSTAWAYENLRLSSITKRPDNPGMVLALAKGDRERIASGMVNVLEGVTALRFPEILRIKDKMMERGALGAVMSGSGPTVVGLFRDVQSVLSAAEYFGRLYKEVITTKTVT